MSNDGHKQGRSGSKDVRNKEKVTRSPKVKTKKEKVVIPNVFSPNFAVIDNALDELKKAVREYGISHYACNNIKNAIGEALMKVRKANL